MTIQIVEVLTVYTQEHGMVDAPLFTLIVVKVEFARTTELLNG